METYIRICVLSENHVLGIVNTFFFRSEQRSISRNTWLATEECRSADDSDGVHGRVRAAASLCFFLAAQTRKLSFLASLGWAEEAKKRHARNSDGNEAIIEVLSYPLCFRSLRLVVVGLDRSSWWQKKIGLATAMIIFEAPPPGYAVLRSVAVVCSRERGCYPGCHSLRFTIYRLGDGRR